MLWLAAGRELAEGSLRAPTPVSCRRPQPLLPVVPSPHRLHLAADQRVHLWRGGAHPVECPGRVASPSSHRAQEAHRFVEAEDSDVFDRDTHSGELFDRVRLDARLRPLARWGRGGAGTMPVRALPAEVKTCHCTDVCGLLTAYSESIMVESASTLRAARRGV